MANKHMKSCSTLYIIRNMQIKMRHHYRPIRTAEIQNQGKVGEQQELSLFVGQNCKIAHPLWKTLWQFLTKLNTLLLYNPAVVFLRICPKNLKTMFPQKPAHGYL
jgi:hypothetical protein